MSIIIAQYNTSIETEWLHCRVVSFLKTAYHNEVLTSKPGYNNPAIELVAIDENKVVGLLDVEIEDTPKKICSSDTFRSGMIHHIAVHPEHQRKNIGQMMLRKAEEGLKNYRVHRLEAWTRDDQWVRAWYIKNSFKSFYSYLHVVIDGSQLALKEPLPKLNLLSGFGHYTGEDKDKVLSIFPKSHECLGLEKFID